MADVVSNDDYGNLINFSEGKMDLAEAQRALKVPKLRGIILSNPGRSFDQYTQT